MKKDTEGRYLIHKEDLIGLAFFVFAAGMLLGVLLKWTFM